MTSQAEIAANQYRTPVVKKNLYRGAALNTAAGNSRTSFVENWPKGPALYMTLVTVHITLTVGTAAGPITDGILNYIKQMYYKTSNGETLVDNLSARALIMGPAILKAGTVPEFDQIAAANGTYNVQIPIYHSDPLTKRPEDLFVDTRLYDSFELDITLGQMSDLFTTPGTASVTATVDIDLVRSQDTLPANVSAIGYSAYMAPGQQDVTQQTYINMTRAGDIYYKRLYIQSASAGGGVWYGPNSDSIVQTLRVTDTDQTFISNTDWLDNEKDNKQEYSLEAIMAGRNVIDFCRDKSNKSALYSNRNGLRLEWDNQAGVVAGDTVSLVAETYRKYKKVA